MKKLTTEEFIEKAITVHGDKYDYSLVEYIRSAMKVKIICKEHNYIFETTPNNHLSGKGCTKCANVYRKTTEEFITECILIHVDKYDYSLVKYIGAFTKVIIRCKVHDYIFSQTPSDHLSGKGCPKCGGNVKSNTKEFIEKAIAVHGYKYDYSLVVYNCNRTKVKIICKEHNYIFSQTPSAHLQGAGCHKCGGTIKKTTEEFVAESIAVHGDKYDYSLVEYINDRTKVKIKCKQCGYIFQQTAGSNLNGSGCPSCAKTGFDVTKSAYYYYIRFDNPNEDSLYKHGITNTTPKKRLLNMHVKNPWTPTILQEIYFPLGQDALDLETTNKNKYKEFKYNGEHILGNGNTELFVKDILA